MRLIDTIIGSFSSQDKECILRFHNLESNWDVYNFAEFPSIQWKILNLRKLQRNNRGKFEQQRHALQLILQQPCTSRRNHNFRTILKLYYFTVLQLGYRGNQFDFSWENTEEICRTKQMVEVCNDTSLVCFVGNMLHGCELRIAFINAWCWLRVQSSAKFRNLLLVSNLVSQMILIV